MSEDTAKELEAKVANLQVEVHVLARLLQQETMAHKQTQLNAEVIIEKLNMQLEALKPKPVPAEANGVTKKAPVKVEAKP